MLVTGLQQSTVMKLSTVSLVALFTLTGCATPCDSIGSAPHPLDPYEKMNRHVYGFNRMVDKGLIRTLAYGYYAYTPKELQAGIHNVFDNWSQPITIANDLLQAKPGYAVHDTSRFVINTTFGLGGLFDMAQYFGLEHHKEDFGQTLFVWGYKSSNYLMLPFFGPSTVRDTIGWVIDSKFFDPVSYIKQRNIRYGLFALERLDTRAYLLRGEKLLESVGIDEYAFIRTIYFQRRTFDLYDGNPPISEVPDEDPFAEPGFDSTSDTGSDPFAEPGFDTEPTVKPETSAPLSMLSLEFASIFNSELQAIPSVLPPHKAL